MFSTVFKAVTLCMWVWYINNCIHAFYTWVARRKVVYDTQHVRRTIAYTVQDMKSICRAKIKVFYMNLMFDYWLVTRLKHGVVVEGEGA